MADTLLFLYLIFFILVCVGAFTKTGQELQYEYMAFRDTKRFMHSKGLKWPPNERWS